MTHLKISQHKKLTGSRSSSYQVQTKGNSRSKNVSIKIVCVLKFAVSIIVSMKLFKLYIIHCSNIGSIKLTVLQDFCHWYSFSRNQPIRKYRQRQTEKENVTSARAFRPCTVIRPWKSWQSVPIALITTPASTAMELGRSYRATPMTELGTK